MQQRRCVCVCVLSRSVVSYALRPCGLYSLLGFSVHGRIPDKNSRQEHWSGLPFPPAGDLPDPGTEPASLTSPALAGGFFTTTATLEVPSNPLSSVQFSSVAQSCPTVCDPMDCSMPGLPAHHQLSELAQTHVHRVGDAIQPSHLPSSPSPPASNLSQHQGLFQ